MPEHLPSHVLRHGNVHCLQLRRWVRSVDFLCGDFRHRHWLLNGRGLRHVRSSFHHLRQDPQHKNSDLFDLFDLACDVIHAVALLLFLTSKHKDFNHESGFLKELTTELLLLLPSNWSSGCFSKYATNAFTSGPGHDFKMWICGTACAATMRDFIVPRRMLGSQVVVSWLCCGAWSVSYPQLPWQARHGCIVGIDRDPPRQGGGSTRGPALACVLAVACCTAHVVASVDGGCVV